MKAEFKNLKIELLITTNNGSQKASTHVNVYRQKTQSKDDFSPENLELANPKNLGELSDAEVVLAGGVLHDAAERFGNLVMGRGAKRLKKELGLDTEDEGVSEDE